ncbi:MAG: protein kinase, partial [Chitinivibrionales bacterium]|nr:protein kinase [Chitinivibrionales bacterium]MBD3396725.1 protein kinase [Chitinivibrionales bacterium]
MPVSATRARKAASLCNATLCSIFTFQSTPGTSDRVCCTVARRRAYAMSDKPAATPGRNAPIRGAVKGHPGSILKPGDRVGRLRIAQYVAAGGMAEIYKAVHEELEVTRAVKILKPGYTPEDKARFQTEAKISAHLHHPNIVQIYTVDLWEDSLPYIEMEFVEGTSLADLLARHRRLPFDFSLAVTSIVCNALEYAQRQNFTVYGKVYSGLVHRDIKPANILLAADGSVKLADFGIALPGNVSLHTVGPNTMGTYAYLSPEQLDGKTLDQRSDIYALGTVLYEMITGFKAFPDKTVPELVRNKLGGTYRPIQSIIHDIPKPLVRVIDKSLAVDRKKRFDEASEFGAALRRVLAELTGRSAPAVVIKHLNQPSQGLLRRRRRLFSADWLVPIFGGGAVLAFIIAAIVAKTSINTEPSQTVSPDALPVSPQELPAAEETLPKTADMPPPGTGMPEQPRSHAQAKNRIINRAHRPSQKPRTKARANPSHHRMQVLESYIENNDLGSALEFAEMHDINDGYYHYLRGKAFHLSGDLARAESALNKAQTERSTYRADTKRLATRLWARNRTTMYRKKPNADNRKTALKAWQSYQRAFCGKG